MALKRATFYIHTPDQQALDTQKYIEDSGWVLDVRNLEKHPLSERELQQILGHWDLRPFLNPFSKSFEKHKLDEVVPPREQLLKLIAEDNTLLRRPLIRTPRLLTFGNDRAKISEMFQIDPNAPTMTVDERADMQPSNGRGGGGYRDRDRDRDRDRGDRDHRDRGDRDHRDRGDRDHRDHRDHRDRGDREPAGSSNK